MSVTPTPPGSSTTWVSRCQDAWFSPAVQEKALRLVDAIELEYGVEVELNGPGGPLDTLDDLVALLAAARPDEVPEPVEGPAPARG
ncbi:hypothetical protein ACFY2R_27955 [Micromonospora olivasterospora]|uniref:hypothetical protein n=1 Tax=Micromonospora olivasterospora TaxID=1880 RepID=UPI0011A84404|nr:hypothetical protein [Micromonospora olivasterospora]